MATASAKGDAKEDASASEVARLREENEQLKKRYDQLLRHIGVVANDAYFCTRNKLEQHRRCNDRPWTL